MKKVATVVDEFRRTFLANGYKEEQKTTVFPCPDKMTLFTCATISVLKNHILTESLEKVFIFQPCLRTQNLKRTLDGDFDPEYLSSFLMLGMLCPIKRFEPNCVSDFFGNFPELKGKILIRSSKVIAHEALVVVEKMYPTEYESRNLDYYIWHYGEDFLSGKGLTFALKQPDGEYLDIGNLVIIYKHNEPTAIEFGFGQETFMARFKGLKTPYATSSKYLNLGLGITSTEKRLGDALITAYDLFCCGVKPGKGKASSVMRKALRGACFLAVKEFGQSAVLKLRYLASKMSIDPVWIGLLEKTLIDIHKNITAFNHETEHIRKHAMGQYLMRKILEYRQRYNLPEKF